MIRDRIDIDYNYLIKNLNRDKVSYYTTIERNGYVYNIFTEFCGEITLINVVSYTKEIVSKEGVTDIIFSPITYGRGYTELNENILKKESIKLIDKMYKLYQKR